MKSGKFLKIVRVENRTNHGSKGVTFFWDEDNCSGTRAFVLGREPINLGQTVEEKKDDPGAKKRNRGEVCRLILKALGVH